MFEVQGILIRRAVMAGSGDKPDRKILQVLCQGPSLFTLVNVQDQSRGEQPGLKVGETVSLPVTVGAYNSRSGGAQISYTFWGFPNGQAQYAVPSVLREGAAAEKPTLLGKAN